MNLHFEKVGAIIWCLVNNPLISLNFNIESLAWRQRELTL